MIERRPVETIVDELHAAERELASAPKGRWLEIMERIDLLLAEYRAAVYTREAAAEPVTAHAQ